MGCAVGFCGTLQNEDAHLFAASPIFKHGSVDFLRSLSGLMVTKKYEEGKTIFDEGDTFNTDVDHVYWILKGAICSFSVFCYHAQSGVNGFAFSRVWPTKGKLTVALVAIVFGFGLDRFLQC